MSLRRTLGLFSLMTGALASGCDADAPPAHDNEPDHLRAAVIVSSQTDAANTDVIGVFYELWGEDGRLAAHAYAALDNQYLPGNFQFGDSEQLGDESAHRFASHQFVVEAGHYYLLATPLRVPPSGPMSPTTGEQPLRMPGDESQDCHAASRDQLKIRGGKNPVSAPLFLQCDPDGRGALDVAAALNHPPQIDGVQLETETLDCGSPSSVCLSYSDSDLDPLEAELQGSLPDDCSIEPTTTQPDRQCWSVLCTQPGPTLALEATVFDLLAVPDPNPGALPGATEWIRFETYFEQRDGVGPHTPQSRASRTIYLPVAGVLGYADTDADTFGTPISSIDPPSPKLFCNALEPGYVDNDQDCDDSDGEVHPGAEELCDGIDNNCDGDIDEGFDLTSDPNHCGECGVQCQSGATCINGVCELGEFPPQVCDGGQVGVAQGDDWVVCAADESSAWVSTTGSGQYAIHEICAHLGYADARRWGGNCGNICGYCESTETTCLEPGRRIFDGQTEDFDCDNPGVHCYAATWECQAL